MVLGRPDTRDVFKWVDPDAWDASVHDPMGVLGVVPRERLDALVDDPGFMRFLGEVRDEHQRYLEGDRWFQARDGSPLRSVAYFSPEFGIAEALPQYSGGLGVLAGDHLKAASDLGVPLVGIGLFYRHGYFRQSLTADGWQQERYPDLDPHAMALVPCDGIRVEVDLAGAPLVARVWKAEVGRVPLYLLDADVDENPPDLRDITDRLYGGETEHRLRQEILLGIGGVRALDALGIDTQVFHTNEGHAGFLGLERIRRLVADPGLSYHEAIEAVRAGCIFTTHTPVPAGIDRFPRELIERYFSDWAKEVGITLDELMELGHRPGDTPDERFNMAVMGLRLAGRSNAVAKLHGEVSREMFSDLWPDVPQDEIPITVGHQRRARPHVGGARHGRRAHPPRAARVARGRGRPLGAPGRRPRRRDLARTRAGPRGARRVRPSAVGRSADGARAVVERRRVDRLRARPPRAHDRLRPPLRHLQARHAAALTARPAQGPAPVRRPAGAAGLRRQVAPRRRLRQGADPPGERSSPPTRRCATGSCSWTTTTSPWPAPCSKAPTCGSTTRADPKRRVARPG